MKPMMCDVLRVQSLAFRVAQVSYKFRYFNWSESEARTKGVWSLLFGSDLLGYYVKMFRLEIFILLFIMRHCETIQHIWECV